MWQNVSLLAYSGCSYMSAAAMSTLHEMQTVVAVTAAATAGHFIHGEQNVWNSLFTAQLALLLDFLHTGRAGETACDGMHNAIRDPFPLPQTREDMWGSLIIIHSVRIRWSVIEHDHSFSKLDHLYSHFAANLDQLLQRQLCWCIMVVIPIISLYFFNVIP